MTKVKQAPFAKTVEHSMELRGMDLSTALTEVQARYDSFTKRNERLTERQNDEGNKAQIQLISHFALLATLALTVTGLLITQTAQSLTDAQKILILVVLSIEATSLLFGALDYLQTIRFHTKWAKIYQNIGNEVGEKVSAGEVQEMSDLVDIERKYLKKVPESTKKWITILMVSLCFLGLGLLILLFYVYFFDVPFWGNIS